MKITCNNEEKYVSEEIKTDRFNEKVSRVIRTGRLYVWIKFVLITLMIPVLIFYWIELEGGISNIFTLSLFILILLLNLIDMGIDLFVYNKPKKLSVETELFTLLQEHELLHFEVLNSVPEPNNYEVKLYLRKHNSEETIEKVVILKVVNSNDDDTLDIDNRTLYVSTD